MPRKRVFTIYDKMEDDGYFEKNPANAGARDEQRRNIYKGPVAFPRMVYHPEGHYRISTAAQPHATPFGPKMLGEQRALIDKICEDQAEYDEAKAAGWHDTPGASAVRNPEKLTKAEIDLASLPAAPAALTGSAAEAQLASLLSENARLKKQLSDAEAE